MTVAVNDTIERYVIAGVGPYAYTWRIFNDTDLQVQALSAAVPPVPTLLTYITHYTVTGANVSSGGVITLTAGAAATYAGYTLDIRSNTPRNQSTSIRNIARFLPEIHEDAYDYLDRQLQDMGRLVDASVRTPDNELPLAMILPPLATRTGKYAAYDPLGQPIASSGTGNDSALRVDLASTTSGADGSRLAGFRQVAAGSAARSVYSKLRRLIDLEDFAAVIDGVTSDYTYWQNVLTYIGTLSKGADIRLPEGISAIASASLLAASLSLPSNCRIIGEGEDRSQILVTGVSACNLFSVLNKTRIRLEGVCLRGNSTATTSANGMAIDAVQSTAAAAAGENFALIDCGFENFGGDSWIRFKNDSATFTFDGFNVERLRIKSEAGNSRDPTSLVVASDVLVFQGQSNGAVGLLQDVNVSDARMDLQYVKNGITFWHSTKNCKVRGGVLKNSGVTGAQDNKAGYAIKVYDNSSGAGGVPPDLAHIDGVSILDPRSAGLYCASANRIKVTNSFCKGQTDSVDATLPKGAFVINGATNGIVEDCVIDDCYGGINLNGATASDRLYARNNTITNIKTNGLGIVGSNLSFAGKMKRLEIVGNTVEAPGSSARAVYLRFSSTNGCDQLVVRDNPCLSGVFSCLEITNATVPLITYADMANNGIVGVGTFTGVLWNTVTGTRANFSNLRWTGTWDTTGVGFDVRSSTGLTIKDLEFCDMSGVTTGRAIRTGAAQGRLEGIRWNGVADARRIEASGAEDLGIDTPTWTGVPGDFIQNINPADTTIGALNSILAGWTWTTAWRVQHEIRA